MKTSVRIMMGVAALCCAVLPAKACFEVIPKIHAVTCYYDTTNFHEFMVRVGSLRLETNVPGTLCTFAFHNNAPILDWIDYIAVVDSGTNHRTDGISQWYRSAAASSGWDSIYQIVWDGFLGGIEGAGTTAGTPVELIIRCHFTPGYALIPLFNDLRPTIMGWGDWDDSLQRPMPNRWWLDWPVDSTFQFIPIHAPSSFFSDFDADLVYTSATPDVGAETLKLFPQPAHDVLNLFLPQPAFSFRNVDVYDVQGRPVLSGLHSPTHQLAIDISTLAPGMYFLRFRTAKGVLTRRFWKE